MGGKEPWTFWVWVGQKIDRDEWPLAWEHPQNNPTRKEHLQVRKQRHRQRGKVTYSRGTSQPLITKRLSLSLALEQSLAGPADI